MCKMSRIFECSAHFFAFFFEKILSLNVLCIFFAFSSKKICKTLNVRRIFAADFKTDLITRFVITPPSLVSLREPSMAPAP